MLSVQIKLGSRRVRSFDGEERACLFHHAFEQRHPLRLCVSALVHTLFLT